MRHKLYIWETLESPIKLISYNTYNELLELLKESNLPEPKTPEYLESLLSLKEERSIYAFPIRENHVNVLTWYDNLNMARKEKDWFLSLKKASNVKRNLPNKRKR